MARREGESEKEGGEAPEEIEASLEDYLQRIRQKYQLRKGEETRVETNARREKGTEAEGQNNQLDCTDNGQIRNSTTETTPERKRVDEASGRTEANPETTQQIDSQHRDKERSADNTEKADARAVEKGEVPEDATNQEELEALRDYLSKKYPHDVKNMAGADGVQETKPSENEEKGEAAPIDENLKESGNKKKEEEIPDRKPAATTDSVETPANDHRIFSENAYDSSKEDVGWKRPEEPQPREDEYDFLGSRNPTREIEKQTEPTDSKAANKSADAQEPHTEPSQAVKIQGEDRVDSSNPEQANVQHEGKSQQRALANQADSSAEQESTSQGQRIGPEGHAAVSRGGGNLPFENDKRMSGKGDSPADHKEEGDEKKKEENEEEEIDYRQPIIRKAAKYMDSHALILPEKIIPPHEERYDVFEARISRVVKPKEEYKVYMTHKPGHGKAYLPIRHVGAEKGEEFLVIPPEKYQESDLARDYNAQKPKGLENTWLLWREDKLFLKVDNTELELRNATLRAQEGKAVLDAKLNDEEKNAVKIAKGIDGFDFRFDRDHAILTSINECKEGLMTTYQRTQNDIPPHQRLIAIPEVERSGLQEWRHEFKVDAEGLSADKSIDCKRDKISVIFSKENQMKAATYWGRHESEGAKKWHQGDIGEAITECLLEKSGFKIVSEHTSRDRSKIPKHKSEEHGMDRVVEKEGAYYVVEVKHWRDRREGLEEARKDISGFKKEKQELDDVERDVGGRIKGGIAVEVHWSYRELEAVIYTDYVEF